MSWLPRRRPVQLALLAAVLLVAGPLLQLLQGGRGHAVRGQRSDLHKLGMGAFVGDTALHAHAVSAVSAWHEDEAKRSAAARAEAAKRAGAGGSADAAAALEAAVSAHAELDRLHQQQREMIELHLAAGQHGDDGGGALAQAELWAQAEVEDYVAHHRKPAGARAEAAGAEAARRALRGRGRGGGRGEAVGRSARCEGCDAWAAQL